MLANTANAVGSERINKSDPFNFWRTYDGKEVDLVEENEGILSSYEFKWSKYKNNNKTRELWNNTYPNAPLSVINNQNYLDFVL